MQIAEATNHVFRSAHFKQASTDFIRTGSNSFDDRRERDSVSPKFVRIDVDLILAHESANRGYLGHSWNRLKFISQRPILKAAQFGQNGLMGVVHQGVFND